MLLKVGTVVITKGTLNYSTTLYPDLKHNTVKAGSIGTISDISIVQDWESTAIYRVVFDHEYPFSRSCHAFDIEEVSLLDRLAREDPHD